MQDADRRDSHAAAERLQAKLSACAARVPTAYRALTPEVLRSVCHCEYIERAS
jgi:hypothetical protein